MTISDLYKITEDIKFPILLYISNKNIKIESQEELVNTIISLYKTHYPILKLKYEEIEYIEFEEIVETNNELEIVNK